MWWKVLSVLWRFQLDSWCDIWCICVSQLPRYSCVTAEIVVKVNLKNQAQLLTKRTAPDHHYVSLIIGNSDNAVVFQQKLTWGGKQIQVYQQGKDLISDACVAGMRYWYAESLTDNTGFQ